MKLYTSKTVKAALIVAALLAMVGALYAVFPDNPSQGDYWYNRMSIHGNFASTNGWQYYNGSAWVDATQAVTSQQQPFTKNIYLSNTAILKDNFTLAGSIISNPEDPDRNIRFTVNGACTFNLTNTGTVTVHSVLVEDDAYFINRGTVNLPYTDAASEFYVETGSLPQRGGHLDNYGTINVNGRFRLGYEASMISREGGVIQGPGRMETESQGATAGDYRVSIANAGGWDAAFQLAGYDVAPLSFYFIGETDQVTGANLPQPIYNMTVDSGHKLTLSGPIEVKGINNPYNDRPDVRVASGSTLDLGEHVISSQTTTASGVSKFILEEGATIRTAHPDGISSIKNGRIIGSGAIQLNDAEYSSGANYVFNGTGPNGRQYSGDFETVPQTNTVNIIINESNSMLLLDDSFYPLTATTGYQGNINTQTGIGEGYILGQTLPVEMSYFNAIYNGFNSVMLQWETQSETNNLGFYVLRAKEAEASQALLVSALIPAANTSQGAVYCFEDKDLYDDGIYYYWLQDVSFSGSVELHGPAIVQVTLNAGSNQTPDIPMKTSLVRNYPNPFNPSTQFEYYLEKGSDVDFKVYNLKGQVVDQFTLRNQESGFHRYTWEPQLGSGVYLIRFTADGVSNTRKVILSK